MSCSALSSEISLHAAPREGRVRIFSHTHSWQLPAHLTLTIVHSGSFHRRRRRKRSSCCSQAGTEAVAHVGNVTAPDFGERYISGQTIAVAGGLQ